MTNQAGHFSCRKVNESGMQQRTTRYAKGHAIQRKRGIGLRSVFLHSGQLVLTCAANRAR